MNNPRFVFHIKSSVRWLAILVFAATGSVNLLSNKSLPVSIKLSTAGKHPVAQEQRDSTPTTIYFPLVYHTYTFMKNTPIWAHSSPSLQSEVALFRHTFETSVPVNYAELQIFADTRYELWIDGDWVGRGPARFSRALREYDTFELGTLGAGEHLIAVLVQWAPNNRRSESVTPMLKAHIEGTLNGQLQVLTRTGSIWKSSLSSAWRQDAVPVHSWGLIGPTELLDLRLFPENWMHPGYDDSTWLQSVEINPSIPTFRPLLVPKMDQLLTGELNYTKPWVMTKYPLDQSPPAIYYPRSIPHLINKQIPSSIIDTGLLSPGFAIGELDPQISDPYTLTLWVKNPGTIIIETLSEDTPIPEAIQFDGGNLSWLYLGGYRPDVYRASFNAPVGWHNFTFSNIPPDGLTFSVSEQNVKYPNFPFEQGIHAGRRLLLAEPVSQPAHVISSTTAGGLNLTFNSVPTYVVLDLGRTVHGRLSAEATGPDGALIDIGWDERLATSHERPLPYPGSLHPQWNQVDSWILDGSTHSISTIDARTGRYILIGVWGEAPVQLQNIRISEERYPLTQIGEFHSSNPLLDQIWQLGADTSQVNMTDAYADPWRERGQWWGDAYVVDHVNRVAFGDTGLLKRGILFMSNSLNLDPSPGMAPNNNGLHMLDYTMLWVHSLYEYMEQTQDNFVLNSTYSKLLQFMGHLESYENPETGLLDLPQKNWAETAYIDTFGYHSRYGQSTALNSIYYGTLQDASKLAELFDDTANSIAWQNKAGVVKDGINNHLYLPSENKYLTNIYDGEPHEPSPYAQAWPLAYGVVPQNEVEQVIESLLELLSSDPSSPNVNIYGMYWVLEALGRTDHIPDALDIMELYYGHLVDLGATMLWEHFNSNLYQWASLSHGWGGAPTWFLTTYVLGARQTGPNSWLVKPALDGLDNASGALPLRDGTLHIEWERVACQEAHITINAENNSSGEVYIPFLDPSMIITLDGQTIWEDETGITDIVAPSPNGIIITVNGGTHTINIHTDC